jgi:hypothetical protein
MGEVRRSNLFYLAFAICIASLGLLVANVQGSDLGGSGSVSGSFAQLQKFLLPLALGLWAAVLIYLIYRSIGMKMGRGRSQGQGSTPSIIGIIVFLIVLSGFAFLTGSAPKMMEPDPDASEIEPGVPEGPRSPTADISGSYTAILLVALFAVILIPILRFRRGKDAFGTISKNEKMEESTLVREAIGELKGTANEDLRGVVLNTYRQMLHLVQERIGGTGPMTPRELAELTIGRLNWPENDVRGLTEVFELARYSTKELSEKEKEKAIDCLDGIEQSIASGGVSDV